MVVTLDSHAAVSGSNPVATIFFFFSFVFNTLHILKLHISYKISLVYPIFFFFFYSLFIFSPTVSIRIFINEMVLSCYLSMLVILNLFNRFATFRI